MFQREWESICCVVGWTDERTLVILLTKSSQSVKRQDKKVVLIGTIRFFFFFLLGESKIRWVLWLNTQVIQIINRAELFAGRRHLSFHGDFNETIYENKQNECCFFGSLLMKLANKEEVKKGKNRVGIVTFYNFVIKKEKDVTGRENDTSRKNHRGYIYI